KEDDLMKKLIELQKMIYPDLLEAMETRFKILYSIFLFEPIGRRGLVEQTSFTERYIRNEIELLQMQGLIKVTTQGMYITDKDRKEDDLMKKLNELQKMIYTDLLEAMETRFKILYSIFLFEPIGRRGLVEQTSFTERYIRNEIELLQMQGLIKVTTQGMYITDNGKLIINNLDDFI